MNNNVRKCQAQALLKRKVDVKILCLAVTYCPRSQGSYECKGKVGRETVYLPNDWLTTGSQEWSIVYTLQRHLSSGISLLVSSRYVWTIFRISA